MKLMTGNSNVPLVQAIAQYLEMPITEASVRRFADEEIFVEINENVRGEDVFVVQSTAYPANDHLMELLICIDALRRASAKRITAVVPYFGYARQDRKPGPRTPISAKLVANLIAVAGANRVLSIDLHAGQIQGFFDIPTDNLYAAPVMSEDIKARFSGRAITMVSPDVGGVVRARALAKRLDNAPLAIVDKRREKPGESEVMNIIGDVQGRFCVLIDDIVNSAGTLCNAAAALKEAAPRTSSLIAPMACFRARRRRGSILRSCPSSSSPIRSPPMTPPRQARRSACSPSRPCSPSDPPHRRKSPFPACSTRPARPPRDRSCRSSTDCPPGRGRNRRCRHNPGLPAR